MSSTPRGRNSSIFASLFGAPSNGSPEKKYSLQNLATLHASLARTIVVNDKNRDSVVESIRAIAELIIWGDKHDPAIFEFFLEKNVLGIFWRILAQERTPISVKQQLLQTLSILIQNIEAGPSVYYILSNNHINELITHPFDLSNEELLAYYVSLLKAIALRLDQHTVQFFIDEQRARKPPPAASSVAAGGAGFPLFDEAIKLWTHEERMVRTAVRTIVLSICKVDDAAVRTFVSRSPYLLKQLSASLRHDCTALMATIRDAAAATAPSGGQLGAMEGALQQLLDEIYFLNDVRRRRATAAPPPRRRRAAAAPPRRSPASLCRVLVCRGAAALTLALPPALPVQLLEAGVEPLCGRILVALLSSFLMPLLISPIVGGLTHCALDTSNPASPTAKETASLAPPPSPLSAAILAAAASGAGGERGSLSSLSAAAGAADQVGPPPPPSNSP
jgi:hypothetical protein